VTHHIHLLRHVKSSWDDPGLPDHDRPLAPRGRRAAERLSRHVAATGMTPDLVLCSSATRAVETWEGIRSGLPPDTPVEVSQELYQAAAPSLLRRLSLLPEAVGTVLIIGHNPSIEALAIGLTGAGAAAAIDRMKTKYPTGALATLVVEGAWADLAWESARLEGFVVPKEL
jgi:phosphohistidine phosphatase